MHCCAYLFEKKRDPFHFVILLNALPKSLHDQHYWTTFETLAEIERDCKE